MGITRSTPITERMRRICSLDAATDRCSAPSSGCWASRESSRARTPLESMNSHSVRSTTIPLASAATAVRSSPRSSSSWDMSTSPVTRTTKTSSGPGPELISNCGISALGVADMLAPRTTEVFTWYSARQRRCSAECRHPLLEQALDVRDGNGLGEVEPLGESTAEGARDSHLLVGFDALRDHADADRVGHLADGADDRRVVRALGKVLHERAVELDHRERQSLQVPERGEADPEVVEHKPNAESLQGFQGPLDEAGLVEDCRLGELQPEVGRIDPIGLYGPLEV